MSGATNFPEAAAYPMAESRGVKKKFAAWTYTAAQVRDKRAPPGGSELRNSFLSAQDGIGGASPSTFSEIARCEFPVHLSQEMDSGLFDLRRTTIQRRTQSHHWGIAPSQPKSGRALKFPAAIQKNIDRAHRPRFWRAARLGGATTSDTSGDEELSDLSENAREANSPSSDIFRDLAENPSTPKWISQGKIAETSRFPHHSAPRPTSSPIDGTTAGAWAVSRRDLDYSASKMRSRSEESAGRAAFIFCNFPDSSKWPSAGAWNF